MRTIDWIALGVIVLAALVGLRRGLVAGAFSLAGIVVGAVVGARLAPQFLRARSRRTRRSSRSAVRSSSPRSCRAPRARRRHGPGTLLAVPPLRLLDTVGGVALGAATGVALVWVAGAVALHLPGQTEVRQEVQRSRILSEINERVPPTRLLDAIARVDPFNDHRPSGPGRPARPRAAPGPGRAPRRESILRVTGTACGLGVVGSGWIARPQLVVTNAHVVAGMKDARVDRGEGRSRDASVVFFDPRNDVAVLRVPGLDGRPLPLAEPGEGRAVAILATRRTGRSRRRRGGSARRRPSSRTTPTAAARPAAGRPRFGRRTAWQLRRPAVDSAGRVQTTVFAARVGSDSGYGVPAEIVRSALDRAKPARASRPGRASG